MNKISAFLLIVIMIGCSSQNKFAKESNVLTNREIKSGWRLLFDGKSGEFWRSANNSNFPAKGWTITDHCLVSNGGGNLVSKEEFGNFDFDWDWKMITPGGNSGIKYFVKEENGNALGIEYQMLDDFGHPWMKNGQMIPNDYHTVGAVYELYPTSSKKIVRPVGTWNHSRILSRGMHVEHWLNGVKLAEYERGSADFKARIARSKFSAIPGFGLHGKGLLLLQDHGSEVYFKNLKIKIL